MTVALVRWQVLLDMTLRHWKPIQEYEALRDSLDQMSWHVSPQRRVQRIRFVPYAGHRLLVILYYFANVISQPPNQPVSYQRS